MSSLHTTTAHAHSAASQPAQNFAHPPRNIRHLGIMPGMKVADFGAGSGAYVFLIAEALAGSGHVYALDVQRDLLARIKTEAGRRRLQNIQTVWCDVEQMNGSKLAERHVDIVLISNLLFQVEQKEALFTESWRILKPTGKLAIIDWTDSYKGMGPHKKEVVTKDAALGLARANGFELVREFAAGAHHYGLLLRPVPLSK